MIRFFFAFLFSLTSLFAAEGELLSDTPKIVYYPHFLSDAECDHLIALARPYLKRSTVVNESKGKSGAVDSRRTSEGMFLTSHPDDRIVQKIDKRLSQLTGYPRENGEAMQVLHYSVGAEYRPHYDYFNPATAGGAAQLKRGGQRLATVIMYLNTPIKGGETIFPTARVSVQPKKGAAVLFYNCLPSGETDSKTLHGGAPVIQGEKWIATKWFRTRRFI